MTAQPDIVSPLIYSMRNNAEAFSTRKGSALPYPVITGHQVHGCKVAIITRPDTSREELEGFDALVTNLRGVAIGVRTADCVPVLLHDPDRGVVAAVHSGWKGTVQRIVQKALSTMEIRFRCRAEDIRAVIGPCIGPESFQVGEEVVTCFKEQGFPMDDIWFFNEGEGESPMHHGHHIDLVKANTWLLGQSGVLPEHIQAAGIDTYTDESFFSARREGTECGRIINSIRLL